MRETDTRTFTKSRGWLSEAADGFAATWRKSPADKAYLVALIALVVAGIVMRSWGILVSRYPFWLDECAWATLLVEQPLKELLIRPIGFMAVSKAIAAVFGATESSLRAIPWLAAVATTVLSPFLARRLFATRTPRLFFVAIIATNEDAVDFAKEFKPYSLGLMLHCTLLWLVLTYLDTGRMRDLVRALVVGVAAILFTQDIVFALPGALIALAVTALSARRFKELVATGAAGLAGLILVFAQYFFMWSKLPKGESNYWGQKYDVFFLANITKKTHFDWFLDKYEEMAILPGMDSWSWWRSERFSPHLITRLAWWDRRLWSALHVTGVLLLLWRWRTNRWLVLLAPLLTLSVLNALGLWPLGAFRTNLFLLSYSAAIAAVALDWPRSSLVGSSASTPTPTPAEGDSRFSGIARAIPSLRWPFLVLVLGPVLLFGGAWHRIPYSAIRRLQIPDIVTQLVKMQGKHTGAPELVILDSLHCDPWAYHTRHNPSEREKWGGAIERRFRAVCAESDREAAAALHRAEGTDDRVYVLSVERIQGEYPRFHKLLKHAFTTEQRAVIGASTTRQVRWHL